MRMPTKIRRLLELAALSALLAATGCSDAPGACESTGGFTASCRSCDGDLPFGPNASAEACADFGELHECECATFSGSCSNPDLANKARCLVTGCAQQPVCPVPQ